MTELISHFPAFIATTFLLAMVPGQGVAMVMRQSIVGGSKTALLSLMGNSTGLVIWGALSAIGLSAIFSTSDLAYEILKWIGVTYLAVLSMQTFLKLRHASGSFDLSSGGSGSRASAYRLGLITNLTNVKAAVFAVAFLPTFVPRNFPLGLGIFIFGCLWSVVSTSWYLILIWSLHRSATFMEKPRVRRALTAFSAVGILGLAIGLALTAPH